MGRNGRHMAGRSYENRHALLCEKGVWKNCARLLQNFTFIVVSGTVMSEKKFSNVCRLGHLGRLLCRTVEIHPRSVGIVAGICTLMIQHVDALHLLPQIGDIPCVGAIGITPRLVSRRLRRALAIASPSSVTQSAPALILFI